MANNTFKMTKLVGESPDSIEDAVKTALATSAANVHGQSWAHVTEIRMSINDDGSLDTWQVALEVGFKVDA